MNNSILSSIFLLFSLTLFGQDEGYNDWILTQRLPTWSALTLQELRLSDNYTISDHINPFYLEADFDGSNKRDIAIAVIEKISNKTGIVIIHQETGQYFIIGAGVETGNGGDDFSWMDIWKVDMENDKPGLHVEQSESASALIYWSGSQYIWTQRGD